MHLHLRRLLPASIGGAVAALALIASPAAALPFGDQQQLADLGEIVLEAERPAVASGEGKTLAVWREHRLPTLELPPGNDRSDRSAPGIWVISGRFVDGNNQPVGDEFEIGFASFNRPARPDVTFNDDTNEFLVTWRGDKLVIDSPKREFLSQPTLFAQRVGADGSKLTEAPVEVSSLFGDGNEDRMSRVSWSSDDNQYLVVWDQHFVSGRTADFVDIVGMRLNGDTAAPLDPEPLILSNHYDEQWPDVSYDQVSNRWGVSFIAQGNLGRGSDFDQVHVTTVGADGTDLDATAISEFGLRALRPSIAGNSVDGGFAVTWSQATEGDNRIFGDAAEIFARRVDANAQPVGDQVAVSPLDDGDSYGSSPSIAHNGVANEYLITWWNQRNVAQEFRGRTRFDETWGRRMSATLAPLTDAATLSFVDVPFRRGIDVLVDRAQQPVVAFNRTSCTYLSAWDALSNSGHRGVGSRAFDAPDCPVVLNKADSPVRPAETIAPSQVVVRSSVSCKSQRRFQIRLVKRKGRKYRSATVTLNGKRVATLRGSRLQAPVNLTGLAPGTVSVVIRATLTNGRVLRYTRRYKTCSPKLPPSNRLESASAV